MQSDALVIDTAHDPVWMVRRTTQLAAATTAPLEETRDAQLLALMQPSIEARYLLDAKFARTLFLAEGVAVLPGAQLEAALKADNADELFIAGHADSKNEVVLLWRADLSQKPLIVSFDAFPPSGDGTVPDFTKLKIIDTGQTIVLGDYEAAADAILYEHVPEVRARLRKRRIARDKGFGASLRRLRLLRGLTQADFEPQVTRKQIARIEASTSNKARAATLAAIAKKLRVQVEDIESY